MTTLKELRVLSKDYGLPGRSTLRKKDLQKAIDEVQTAEFIKRFQRAQKTGRYSAIRDDDPNKEGSRGREAVQIYNEADAALRASKYIAAAEKKPRLRHKPLKHITDRLKKPHFHGHMRSLRETLAEAIAREGPDIVNDNLDPRTYYALYKTRIMYKLIKGHFSHGKPFLHENPVLYPNTSYVRRGAQIRSKARILEEVREEEEEESERQLRDEEEGEVEEEVKQDDGEVEVSQQYVQS